jgi:hypothetical protein
VTAVEEYIMNKCVEVLENDPEYCEIGEEIVQAESELMESIPKGLINSWLKIDFLKEKQASEAYIKIFLVASAK